MARATVSVILCNYNHARYLPQSLGAICGQTRPADQVIIVDDGSTDDSLAVIERFAAGRDNFLVLRNAVNRGLQYSIARAVGMISSTHFVWTAADDLLLPDFLARSMAALERHPDAGLCFSEITQLIGDTQTRSRFATNPDIAHIFDLSGLPAYLSPEALRQRMRQAYLAIYGNTIVCRYDAIVACGGFHPALEWHSDLFAFYAVAARYGACPIPETLALIRVHPGTYSEQRLEDDARQRRVLAALLDLLRRKDFRDVRRFFRNCPSFFSPFGTALIRVGLRRPADFDLIMPFILWKIREYKHGHRLTWARAVGRLIPRVAHFAYVRLFRA